MIEGGKYHDSLEELFTLQNTAELKLISYKIFTFDFGYKISRKLTKPGRFLCFGFTHLCAFVNVAVSYKSDWRALANELKKATKNF